MPITKCPALMIAGNLLPTGVKKWNLYNAFVQVLLRIAELHPSSAHLLFELHSAPSRKSPDSIRIAGNLSDVTLVSAIQSVTENRLRTQA